MLIFEIPNFGTRKHIMHIGPQLQNQTKINALLTTKMERLYATAAAFTWKIEYHYCAMIILSMVSK